MNDCTERSPLDNRCILREDHNGPHEWRATHGAESETWGPTGYIHFWNHAAPQRS